MTSWWRGKKGRPEHGSDGRPDDSRFEAFNHVKTGSDAVGLRRIRVPNDGASAPAGYRLVAEQDGPCSSGRKYREASGVDGKLLLLLLRLCGRQAATGISPRRLHGNGQATAGSRIVRMK